MSYAIMVFVGGGLGSMARYGVNLLAASWLGTAFPYGTLAVNALGGLVMGLFTGLITPYLDLKAALELRVLLVTGVLGGFTTFSAFSLDAVVLWEKGAIAEALFYVLASLVLAIGGVALGLALTRAPV